MAAYGGAISLSQGRDPSATTNSDEEDSERTPNILSSAARPNRRSSKATKLMIVSSSKGGAAAANDGSSSSKKPRGRPPGSKNKPKPPVVITRDGDGGMRPVILEVAAGADVVDAVVEYARRNRVGISLLSGSGSVSNVTLRHPMTHAPTLSLHGTYHLLCLSGSYLASAAAKPAASSAATFGLTVAGQQGQVFGGIVAGNVTAATTVVVVAATYVSPAYHRLPVMDGGDEGCNHDGSGDGSHEEQRSSAAGATTTSVPPYGIVSPAPLNCQMAPDVMSWGPTSRSPY